MSYQKEIDYITNALTTGTLVMKTACKELGWSFPRIRSRALTIAKRANCTLKAVTRGVYILEPNKTEPINENNNITSDSTITKTVEYEIPDVDLQQN